MAFIGFSRIRFREFEFDPERLALYHAGQMVPVERKALEVLAVLVGSAGDLVSTQEIIDRVWADNQHGVTGIHLAQHISKLRKAFAAFDPETPYIETARGRGYVFKQQVEIVAMEPTAEVENETEGKSVAASASSDAASYDQIQFRFPMVAVCIMGLFAVAVFTAWTFYPVDEAAEIRRVLEESQKYESMVIYRDPANADESKIAEYWLSQEEYGMDVDVRSIRTGIARLLRDESHYGPETRNEQFEIHEIEIGRDRDFATAKTLEKWFIAEYKNDGTLVRNKTVGPYFVHYILRNVGGNWKIERSTTARATKPPPVLDAIENLGGPLAGKEFFISIEGRGFAPDSVFVRAVGPRCPEASPCIVPNSVLRLKSRITETKIDRIPLSLASGEYLISTQNGDSTSSNALSITVK
jgi:DNA-binding winged helix-turn-helix (wHTH) protein